MSYIKEGWEAIKEYTGRGSWATVSLVTGIGLFAATMLYVGDWSLTGIGTAICLAVLVAVFAGIGTHGIQQIRASRRLRSAPAELQPLVKLLRHVAAEGHKLFDARNTHSIWQVEQDWAKSNNEQHRECAVNNLNTWWHAQLQPRLIQAAKSGTVEDMQCAVYLLNLLDDRIHNCWNWLLKAAPQFDSTKGFLRRYGETIGELTKEVRRLNNNGSNFQWDERSELGG